MTIVGMRALKLGSGGLVDGKVHFGKVNICTRLRDLCIEQAQIKAQSSPTTPTILLRQPFHDP